MKVSKANNITHNLSSSGFAGQSKFELEMLHFINDSRPKFMPDAKNDFSLIKVAFLNICNTISHRS